MSLKDWLKDKLKILKESLWDSDSYIEFKDRQEILQEYGDERLLVKTMAEKEFEKVTNYKGNQNNIRNKYTYNQGIKGKDEGIKAEGKGTRKADEGIGNR